MNLLESILWLTLNVYHEARGEGQRAQIAVAHVTLNRRDKRKLSIKGVVLQPRQFSWTHQLDNYWPKNPAAFFECLQSVTLAVEGFDFTLGAVYYHHENVNPKWSKDYVLVEQIDKHKFYR